MPLDREKLTKLLALTTSDNDHEALGCIRAANRMLAADKLTWAEVMAGPEKSFKVSITRSYEAPQDETWVAPHLKDKVMIDLMFRALYTQPRSGNEDFWQWVDDVNNKFNQYGSLTQGQYNALRRCYNRTMRHR